MLVPKCAIVLALSGAMVEAKCETRPFPFRDLDRGLLNPVFKALNPPGVATVWIDHAVFSNLIRFSRTSEARPRKEKGEDIRTARRRSLFTLFRPFFVSFGSLPLFSSSHPSKPLPKNEG
jgi:hypothetical protein